MQKRIEIKITGQVQGVFFRQAAKEVADNLGITGWARNEPDGSVRIVAEGEEEKLQKLAEWCKTGTRGAQVTFVDVALHSVTGEFNEFQIVP